MKNQDKDIRDGSPAQLGGPVLVCLYRPINGILILASDADLFQIRLSAP